MHSRVRDDMHFVFTPCSQLPIQWPLLHSPLSLSPLPYVSVVVWMRDSVLLSPLLEQRLYLTPTGQCAFL
jgi:hypothetical protein